MDLFVGFEYPQLVEEKNPTPSDDGGRARAGYENKAVGKLFFQFSGLKILPRKKVITKNPAGNFGRIFSKNPVLVVKLLISSWSIWTSGLECPGDVLSVQKEGSEYLEGYLFYFGNICSTATGCFLYILPPPLIATVIIHGNTHYIDYSKFIYWGIFLQHICILSGGWFMLVNGVIYPSAGPSRAFSD